MAESRKGLPLGLHEENSVLERSWSQTASVSQSKGKCKMNRGQIDENKLTIGVVGDGLAETTANDLANCAKLLAPAEWR